MGAGASAIRGEYVQVQAREVQMQAQMQAGRARGAGALSCTANHPRTTQGPSTASYPVAKGKLQARVTP